MKAPLIKLYLGSNDMRDRGTFEIVKSVTGIKSKIEEVKL
jgi:hypothetical protein